MRIARGLVSDVFSLGTSQVVAVLGQLVGVRLLTEVLSPAVFGEASLLLGVAALATSTLINPTLQTLLRHYPAYVTSGNPSFVEDVAAKNIWRTAKVALPISLPLLVTAVLFHWITLVDVLLISALVGVDGLRMFQTTILNATSQHGRYGAWQVGEAWGRPLVAYLAVMIGGVRTETVLAAFVVTSAALYAVLGRSTPAPEAGVPPDGARESELLQNFRTYARPLIPLGVIGWISGMADRYMIGGLLSAKDVGTYVAVYGLASRPMLMLSNIVETAIRPAYYSAVAHKSPTSKRYLGVWLLTAVTGAAAMCLIFSFYHQHVSQLLLGQEFREASHLMPWIAVGYGVLALSHISTRICYAHDATRSVLATEAAGACFAVVVGFPLIYLFGLQGAAVAVPIYFGIQLFVSAYLARRSLQDT
ncbi:MAG: lipopolysaccharide biosynthesis protein [Nitrospirota bacterium]